MGHHLLQQVTSVLYPYVFWKLRCSDSDSTTLANSVATVLISILSVPYWTQANCC